MSRPLGREGRLRKTSQFQAVLHRGRSLTNDLVVLRVRANGMETSRVGISVGRRLGGAVVRNRVKRRLRELVRHTYLKDGWDIVLIARGPAAGADFRHLGDALSDLFRRAGLAKTPTEGDKGAP